MLDLPGAGHVSPGRNHGAPLTRPERGWLTLEPANDALQQLPRLRHHEPQAVQVDKDFEQLRTVKSFNRLGELAALAQGSDEIAAGVRGPSNGGTIVIHA